ncbi:MAG: CBS domain-containing protein [Blastocatellia bacterium]
MSRSKQGIQSDETANTNQQANEPAQNRANLDERLGARGQTDYTGGRESYHDFPRRSTSARGRDTTSSESREPHRSTRYGSSNRAGTEYDYKNTAGRYRSRESSPYGTRGELREGAGDVYPRDLGGRTGSTERGRYGSSGRFGGSEDYGRAAGRYEDEGRYARHTYDDLRSGRADHEDFGRRSERYRGGERDYNQGGMGYGSERASYGDTYNREALSGRYDYGERGYGSSADYRDYDRRDEDYDARRDWRGQGRERNMLRCSDIMTKDVTACAPTTPLREVADKMDDDNVGVIPVVENGRLVGIVTDRDIVCRVLAEGRDTRSTPASEAMSEDLVTCTPDDSIHEAIRKMSEHQIRRIPICDMNGRLRGIISMADLALEAENDRELAQAMEQISQPTPNQSRRV